MEENTITILRTDLNLLIENVTSLSAALSVANMQLEKMNSMSTQWVLKYHEQKSKVSELEKHIKELENGHPS